MVATYNSESLPDLSGKVIIITGASAGIGLEAAREFVKLCGAHVILACRNLEKAKPFEEELNAAGPGKATLLRIDTSDLSSVRQFAKEFLALNLGRLDYLILNAGMAFGAFRTVPTASQKVPECELQFATNNLGHFLLTQLMLSVLTSTPGSRVVSVSSLTAANPKGVNFDVLKAIKPEEYEQFEAYATSKLGNLLFTHELGKRLKAAGADTLALPVHPGFAATEMAGKTDWAFFKMVEGFLRRFAAGTSHNGAQPTILAVADPSPEEGVYYAPSGFMQMKGQATSTAGKLPPLATDDELSAKFWKFCEELSGEPSSI